MAIKGMMTCKICGRDFPLISEERYTARDEKKMGLTPMITGENEPKLFDAIDCPHCGCQNVIQERKRYNLVEDECDCCENDLKEEEN